MIRAGNNGRASPAGGQGAFGAEVDAAARRPALEGPGSLIGPFLPVKGASLRYASLRDQPPAGP
ncbi:hypothetical protein GCM10023203_56480 [Actinomycetospora straminea]|uniref:Uncharacterized protein n=1 Tax=Actinomycetospora straminea TaxID=663607 RepID=A0ABP9F684_9PSEU